MAGIGIFVLICRRAGNLQHIPDDIRKRLLPKPLFQGFVTLIGDQSVQKSFTPVRQRRSAPRRTLIVTW